MKLVSRRPLILSFIASVALLVAAISNITPKFVWNASESAPLGLYFIAERAIELDEFVLFDPPLDIQNFIEERGYLPPKTPLIKRVSALPGDEICRDETRISINKITVSYALIEDSIGRPMPDWRGCFILKNDEIFLLNDHEKSLDGRYFGALPKDNVVGAAIPIWTYKKK